MISLLEVNEKSLEDLYGWLLEQPRQRMFIQKYATKCILSQYFSDLVGKIVRVGGKKAFYTGCDVILNHEWVGLEHAFDAYQFPRQEENERSKKPVTRDEVLKFLEEFMCRNEKGRL